MNDLIGCFGENTWVLTYTDDLAIAGRGRNKSTAATQLQDEVNVWRTGLRHQGYN